MTKRFPTPTLKAFHDLVNKNGGSYERAAKAAGVSRSKFYIWARELEVPARKPLPQRPKDKATLLHALEDWGWSCWALDDYLGVRRGSAYNWLRQFGAVEDRRLAMEALEDDA